MDIKTTDLLRSGPLTMAVFSRAALELGVAQTCAIASKSAT